VPATVTPCAPRLQPEHAKSPRRHTAAYLQRGEKLQPVKNPPVEKVEKNWLELALKHFVALTFRLRKK
jgi:hypothetical protein